MSDDGEVDDLQAEQTHEAMVSAYRLRYFEL